MSTKKSWLDALKETVEEEPQAPHENPGKPKVTNVQNVQKPREEARGEVVGLHATRTLRGGGERRLLAAGWSPKDRCGPLELTIWADPDTGFYCSQEIALHRLDQAAGTGGGG